MPGGRPLKFESVEVLRTKIDAYFTACEENKEPFTITGLALALDTTRETLLDYEAKDEYSDTIKKAKLMCQNYAEAFLFSGKNATGAIFNLKNNYGWKDKQEVEHSGGVNVNVVKYADTDNTPQLPSEELPASVPQDQ